MQFYPPQGRQEYYTSVPIQHTANPRMNWSPTMHPSPWYDFTTAYPTAYPPNSMDPQRSPAYQVASSNGHEHSSTPHNIRDILGAQQGGTLPSEVAKTPTSYQKSPTSTAAGITAFSDNARSPTTPTHFGKAFEGVTAIYQDIPGSFYMPAIARPLPGKFKCLCCAQAVLGSHVVRGCNCCGGELHVKILSVDQYQP